MKASVIVPAYNSKAFISECLCSIKNQTLQDFECIIVDDGSTDGTDLECHEFAKSDGRFRIVCVEHCQGCGAANGRNTGLSEAKGEYVQFVDSDDALPPEALAESIEFIEGNGLDIAFFDCVAVNRGISEFEWRRLKMQLKRRKEYGILTGEEMFRQMIGLRDFKWHSFLQVSRRDALKHPFPMLPLDEDLVFSVQNLLEASIAGHLPKPLYVKNCRPSSMSTSSPTAAKTESLQDAMSMLKEWSVQRHSAGLIGDGAMRSMDRLFAVCKAELASRQRMLRARRAFFAVSGKYQTVVD